MQCWLFALPFAVIPCIVAAQAPAPAVAEGYTRQTGSLADFVNVNSAGATVVTNPDGSIVLTKTGRFNANADMQTAVPGTNKGLSFGCGGYFEATIAIHGGAVNQKGGWPAFWANDIEKQRATYDGHGSPSTWYEPDIMETYGLGAYGDTIHSWSGSIAAGPIDTNPNFSGVTYPAGFDPSQPHRYGMLWIPATPTRTGSVTFYLDVIPNNSVSWHYNDASPYSQLDRRHLYLILGTGPSNPLRIYKVEVWQNLATACNIGSSARNAVVRTPATIPVNRYPNPDRSPH